MLKRVGGMALSLMLLSSVPGWSAEIEGRVQSVDTSARMVVLEDGTQLWASEGLTLDVTQGAKVKVSYEAQDGKNVITNLEVSD